MEDGGGGVVVVVVMWHVQMRAYACNAGGKGKARKVT